MKDFIKIGDKSYRVEINWDALTQFAEHRGISLLSEMTDIAEMKKEDVALLILYAVQQGEMLEGREANITVEDIARGMRFPDVAAFFKIFNRHMGFKEGKEGEPSTDIKKKKRFLSRR